MRNHEGNHPRIGALDVCPIIPIKPATIVSAKKCVQNIVERIQNENIQVGGWLYRESAIDPKNYELSHVRRGQYETLSNAERKFDFGLFNITTVCPIPSLGSMNLTNSNPDFSAKVRTWFRSKKVFKTGYGLL